MQCWCLSLFFGQSALSENLESTNPDKVELENHEPKIPSLSKEEFETRIATWEMLSQVELSQYLGDFKSFLDSSLSHYKMQPYVLAESFWFYVAFLPHFQQIQADGNLNTTSALNEYSLQEIEQLLTDFYAKLADGSLPVHPWSDAVLSFFSYLVQNPVVGEHGPFFDFSKLPQIPSLTQEQIFIPVDGSYRGNQLYRGLMAFQKLLKDFDEGQLTVLAEDEKVAVADSETASEKTATDKGSGSEEDMDQSLPSSLGKIKWESVISNEPLMYVLRHVPSGNEIYSFLRNYHSGETLAFQCETSYLQGLQLGEQWGYNLEQVLPVFSGSGVKAIEKDLFVLYCLPPQDLEQILADLDCVNTFAPIYFSRSIGLLHRSSEKESVPALENGGTL